MLAGVDARDQPVRVHGGASTAANLTSDTLAAHTLKRMGFSNVKMLVGGYDGWEGHTVETDPSVYK